MSNNPTFWINGTSGNVKNNRTKNTNNIIQKEKNIIRQEENILQKIKTAQLNNRQSIVPPVMESVPKKDWREGNRRDSNRRDSWKKSRKDRFRNKKRFQDQRQPVNMNKNMNKNKNKKLTVKDITNQYSKLLDNLKYNLPGQATDGTADLQTMKDLVVKLYRYIKDVNETFSQSPEERTKHINELIQKLKANKEFNEKLAVVVALNQANKLNQRNYNKVFSNGKQNINTTLGNILKTNNTGNTGATTGATNTGVIANIESLLQGNNQTAAKTQTANNQTAKNQTAPKNAVGNNSVAKNVIGNNSVAKNVIGNNAAKNNQSWFL